MYTWARSGLSVLDSLLLPWIEQFSDWVLSPLLVLNKHKLSQGERMTHRIVLALLIVGLAQLTVLADPVVVRHENGLDEQIATRSADELIPVFIRMRDAYAPGKLLDEVQDMTLPERRQHSIRTLKSHFAATAGDVAAWLENEVTEERAERLYPLWIAHGFSVMLRAGRIAELAAFPSVERIRYDTPLTWEQISDELPASAKNGGALPELDEVSWAIPATGADVLWNLGYTGHGVITAILDSGVLLHLMSSQKLTVAQAGELLNNRSGLLGLSGMTSDMRTLIEESRKGSERARLAIDVCCYRIKKYLGAFLAVLNGADAVIFTGGIGENAPSVRSQCCESLEALGVAVDPEKNERAVGVEMEISPADTATRVWVIPTNEELLIARETVRCVLEARE